MNCLSYVIINDCQHATRAVSRYVKPSTAAADDDDDDNVAAAALYLY